MGRALRFRDSDIEDNIVMGSVFIYHIRIAVWTKVLTADNSTVTHSSPVGVSDAGLTTVLTYFLRQWPKYKRI